MKKLILLLLVLGVLFFIACKESDDEGFSLLRVDDKKDGGGIYEVILYEEGGAHEGSILNGRGGVNNLCKNSPQRPMDKMNFIGFISIDSVDKIGDLPKNNFFPGEVPIKSKTNKIIADSWGELMSGTLNNTLQTLDVIITPEQWWSGKRSGDTIADTCSGFNGSGTGVYGNSDRTDINWIEDPSFGACTSEFRRLLCIAY